MALRVEVKLAKGTVVAHEFEQDFKDLEDEEIAKAGVWFREIIGNHNMRCIVFAYWDGEEYEMTFNAISPLKQCEVGGLVVPAIVYRVKSLSEGFYERLKNLQIEKRV